MTSVFGRYSKNSVCVFIVTSAIIIFVTLNYIQQNDIYQDEQYIKKYIEVLNYIYENRSYKYILYWNKFFGDQENMTMGFGHDIFEDCPVNNCYATNDKSLMPVEEFDAIIFHGPTLNQFKEIKAPKKRTLQQKYIYFSMESPITFPVNRYRKHFYNLTMTYRRDSDIYVPYYFIEKRKTEYQLPGYINNKTKMAAWFVSNCATEGSKIRKKYVKELQKYIPVDVYGKCGKLTCPRSKSDECFKMLEHTYKFYLAFENSLCKDYVTEKLFWNLRLNIIPVVLGNDDYNTIAPPHSVINAADFDSPKQLAEYLVKLSNDPVEYLKYFEWKKDYYVAPSIKLRTCNLCEKINEPLRYSYYDNLYMWSLGPGQSLCTMKQFSKYS